MTAPLPEPEPRSLLRRLPFVLLLAAAGLGYYLYGDALSFEALARHRERLLALRDAHYALTVLVFMGLYTGVVATSLPGATILTLTGGFLFGIFPGFVYNMIGATAGAVLVFLAARMGFGRDVAARLAARGGAVGNFQAALQDNAWSVLLTMRLIPVIPFFIVNLIPAFVGIKLSTFAITTAIGILPADLIFSSLGAGLGEVFARGEVPRLDILLRPEFGLPLLGLGLLSMLPLLIKFYHSRRG